MNAKRRKAIKEVAGRIASLREAVEAMVTDLETIRDEEQEAYDNLPEGIQAGDRGDAMQAAISDLDSAINDLQTLDLDGIETCLEEAAS